MSNKLKVEWRENDGSNSLWVVCPDGREFALLPVVADAKKLMQKLQQPETVGKLLAASSVLCGRIAHHMDVAGKIPEDSIFEAAVNTLYEVTRSLQVEAVSRQV